MGASATTQGSPGQQSRAGAPRWVTPLVVLAALALFAGGALAGWAVAERDDVDGAPTAATEQADGATTPVSGPVGDDASEPVAAVAEAVSPSVVQIETDAGLGSGVVYDDDGHILTAAHVLDGASQLRVRLADGTLIAAEIIGTNEATDVGVIKIDPPADLVPATLGVDTEVSVGQLAVAVGSPFGLEQTVTSGIVSALDRPVETEGSSIVGMIQTDASINPGNSGGALVDRNGRIIGINDAIRTAGGGNEGVGFAIPIDLAVRIADQIIAGEDIRAGLLGVMVSDPTDGPAGALVGEVTPGGPAEDSGLEVGDLIIAIDDQDVSQMQDLRARVLAREPGDTVVLDVLRDGEEIEIELVLGSATD
jgi:putative serine protease PepD